VRRWCGRRGTTRCGNLYGSLSNYLQQANEQITLVVQIESRAGVAAAAEIAAVEGIDGLFIGPADLAAAYGHLGNSAHPDVQQAMVQVHEAARAAGKATGILATVEADARRYLDMGMSFVAVGSDLALLRMHSQALRDKFPKEKSQ
jgi:2-dehydro-3-deoxyglucarate aldolase